LLHLRAIPVDMVNITSVLMAYIIEALNAVILVISVAVLYTLTFGPIPYLLAHTVIFTMYCMGVSVPAIGIAYASYQLLYVVRWVH